MDRSYLLSSTLDVNGKDFHLPRPVELSTYINYNTTSTSYYQPRSSYTSNTATKINPDLPSLSKLPGQLTRSKYSSQSTELNQLSVPSPVMTSSPEQAQSLSSSTSSSGQIHHPSSSLSILSSPGLSCLPSSSYLYQIPQSLSPSYSSSSPSSYTSTPDKDVRNMDDSGNSSGISSDSSPSSQSSDISHPTTSPSSSPVLPKSSSSPEESRVKKNTRTNYSPKQVRCLEKIFLETPYPEPEVMEQLSRNLGIAEKNLKIWFQNKRARWRKRVQNNKHTFPPAYPSYPAPVPSTVSGYSMMSPYSLMSPVVPSPVMSPVVPSPVMSPVVPSPVTSRSIYNLPSKTSTAVNKAAHLLYPTQFPSYTYPPYILPQY